MYKKIIKIRGMHCRSCEILIANKLREITDVKRVDVSLKSNSAEVFSPKEIPIHIFDEKIKEAGYEIGEGKDKSWFNSDKNIRRDLLISFVFLLTFYFIAKKIGLFNISINSQNSSSLAVVFLTGLTAGLSTCMALVGGLVLGLSAKHAEIHPEATSAQKFRPHLYFNLGRILSYIILGGLIGFIGKVFQFSPATLGWMTIIVGIVMMTVGLQLTEISPRLSNVSFSLPSWISDLLKIKKRHQAEYSHKNAAVLGALTFFLPCGFTQAMQLYAISTGSFWQGALIMGIFALGTAPGLLGIGGLSSVVKGIFAKRFFKFAGLVVISLAIFNISNGLNLTGLGSKISFSDNSAKTVLATDPNVILQDGKQVVRMEQLSGGYKPNKFTIKKGLSTKWIINSQDPNSCAASIYSKDLNIRRLLKGGENIIEFTADRAGKIPFMCSMGMYRGEFNVIDDGSGSSQSTTDSQNPSDNSVAKNKPILENSQVLNANYSARNDIWPREFAVKANQPVRLEIYAEDDGRGCMGSVAIPGLADNFEIFKKGEKTIFDFSATEPGDYYITCAMGSPRAIIKVN